MVMTEHTEDEECVFILSKDILSCWENVCHTGLKKKHVKSEFFGGNSFRQSIPDFKDEQRSHLTIAT